MADYEKKIVAGLAVITAVCDVSMSILESGLVVHRAQADEETLENIEMAADCEWHLFMV